jgi:hypothetical protein
MLSLVDSSLKHEIEEVKLIRKKLSASHSTLFVADSTPQSQVLSAHSG